MPACLSVSINFQVFCSTKHCLKGIFLLPRKNTCIKSDQNIYLHQIFCTIGTLDFKVHRQWMVRFWCCVTYSGGLTVKCQGKMETSSKGRLHYIRDMSKKSLFPSFTFQNNRKQNKLAACSAPLVNGFCGHPRVSQFLYELSLSLFQYFNLSLGYLWKTM